MKVSTFDLLLLTTIVAIVAALWAVHPALGVVSILVAVPVAVRSWMVFRRRAVQQIPTPAWQKSVMVLSSLLVVLAISCAALFIAAFGSCSTSTGPIGYATRAPVGQVLIAIVGTIIALGVLGWLSFMWIRHRWRRDTGASRPTPKKRGSQFGDRK